MQQRLRAVCRTKESSRYLSNAPGRRPTDSDRAGISMFFSDKGGTLTEQVRAWFIFPLSGTLIDQQTAFSGSKSLRADFRQDADSGWRFTAAFDEHRYTGAGARPWLHPSPRRVLIAGGEERDSS